MAVAFEDITTKAELIAYHEKHGSGYFFAPDTKRFFKSRVLGEVTHADGDLIFFVTSEQFDENSPRLFTCRFMDAKGAIDTFGKFQQHWTGKEAQAAIDRVCADA